jgi:hypothetical protein
LLISICYDDGGYIAAEIFDAHYLVVWLVRYNTISGSPHLLQS